MSHPDHVQTVVLQLLAEQLVDNACVAEANEMYAVVEIVTTRWAGILLLNWLVLLGADCRATRHHTLVS